MAKLDCGMGFGIVLVLGIGIAQQFLSSIVLGIVLVFRPWYSPSLVDYEVIFKFFDFLSTF